MELKREIIGSGNKGLKLVFHPLSVKKKAVEELDKGLLSIEEAMSKYNQRKRETILTWLRKYSDQYNQEHKRVAVTDAEKRQAVYKIISGMLTVSHVAKQYRKEEITIKRWITLYSLNTTGTTVMAKKESLPKRAPQEIKSLEEQVAFLSLKVIALETIIDIAEKELKIDIRKKAGTKQSKQ